MLKKAYIKGFILFLLVAGYFTAEAEAFTASVPSTERVTILKAKTHSHNTFLSATTETTEDGDGNEKKSVDSIASNIVPYYLEEYTLFGTPILGGHPFAKVPPLKVGVYLLHRQLLI